MSEGSSALYATARARALAVVLFVAVLASGTIAGRLVGRLFKAETRRTDVSAAIEERTAGTFAAPPGIIVHDLAGVERSIVFAGRQRPLLLFIISAECGSCALNFPSWRRLAEHAQSSGAARPPEICVLSGSAPQETAKYLEQHELVAPIYLISTGTLREMGIGGYPATVVVPAAGRELRVWSSVLTEETVQEILAAILEPYSR